jgi:peptide/nickel transport system substrate-binding protein
VTNETTLNELKRYLGDKPLTITRRGLLGAFGATAAAIALREGVIAAPYTKSELRTLAQETGPTAKIVVASGLDLDELDPHYFKSIPSYFAMGALYDNIVSYSYGDFEGVALYPQVDENGDWILEPWLADSWTVSEDEMTITIVLKDGLKFSDGNPLTSADVVATWQRGVDPTSVYSNSVFGLMTITGPDQITAPDEKTVVLTLGKPTVFALKMLATNVLNIMSKAAIEANSTDADKTGHEYFHSNVLGSTAYTLSKWTPGVEWEFAPNPNYWNPGVLKNGGVLNRVIPSAPDRLNLLVNGDVDIAFDLLPKDLADLKTNPDINVYDFPMPWPQYLGFNNRIPPFDNVDVRRAISHGIPYQTIIDQVMFGFAKPLKSPIAEGMPGSDYSFWAYDGGPAKTKEILDGLGISGFSFDMAILIGNPAAEQIAVWIQSSLMEAGVTVNILKMTDAEYLEKFNAGALQTWIGEWYSWVNDPFYHLYWNFLSTSTGTNGVGYNNPRVDELILAGIYEADPAKRAEVLKEAQQIIVDEAPWGLLYQIDQVIAARKNISGYQWNTDSETRYWLVEKA